MSPWAIVVALVFWGLGLLFALALCKASAAADRQSENWMDQKESTDSE